MANPQIVRKWVLVAIFCIGFPIGLFYFKHRHPLPSRTTRPTVNVDFNAVTNFDMDQTTATIADIPQRARDLDGKRVKIVGDMWTPKTGDGDRLSEFQLTDLLGGRTGGPEGPPLAQHFIHCVVNPGTQIYYSVDHMAVYGVWHVEIDHDDAGVIKSVFRIDVDAVEPENQPNP